MELPFTLQFGSMEPETQMGLNHFLADMERAAEDDDIEGILIQADMMSGYPSMLGEVRDALARVQSVRQMDCRVERDLHPRRYWMSTVADEVYLHPEGGMDMRGMGMETTFYKRMLEDLGCRNDRCARSRQHLQECSRALLAQRPERSQQGAADGLARRLLGADGR